VGVPTVVIGLPDINQRIGQRRSVRIQHPAPNQNNLAVSRSLATFHPDQIQILIQLILDRIERPFDLRRCDQRSLCASGNQAGSQS
jgi:hypothetical protein